MNAQDLSQKTSSDSAQNPVDTAMAAPFTPARNNQKKLSRTGHNNLTSYIEQMDPSKVPSAQSNVQKKKPSN